MVIIIPIKLHIIKAKTKTALLALIITVIMLFNTAAI